MAILHAPCASVIVYGWLSHLDAAADGGEEADLLLAERPAQALHAQDEEDHEGGDGDAGGHPQEDQGLQRDGGVDPDAVLEEVE